MRIEVVSYDPERQEVRFRCGAGEVIALWTPPEFPPEVGPEQYVEVDTTPTCVWGVDVTDADPDEPDAIHQDAEGYVFVGPVEGPISDFDLSEGIFCLRIANGLTIFDAEGLTADAAGRRVRVRQKTMTVFG